MLRKDIIPPTTLRIENKGAIETAKGSNINHRNKHVDIHYHFMRDAVLYLLILMEYCSNNMQLADPLTKHLLCMAYERF